jgi:predicted RNase H-like HicB family nuclease
MENDAMSVDVDFWEEGGQFLAHCHSLEISTYGETLAEAKVNFGEALELFYESCKERGVLRETLIECGWTEDSTRQKLSPPKKVDNQSFQFPKAI